MKERGKEDERKGWRNDVRKKRKEGREHPSPLSNTSFVLLPPSLFFLSLSPSLSLLSLAFCRKGVVHVCQRVCFVCISDLVNTQKKREPRNRKVEKRRERRRRRKKEREEEREEERKKNEREEKSQSPNKSWVTTAKHEERAKRGRNESRKQHKNEPRTKSRNRILSLFLSLSFSPFLSLTSSIEMNGREKEMMKTITQLVRCQT